MTTKEKIILITAAVIGISIGVLKSNVTAAILSIRSGTNQALMETSSSPLKPNYLSTGTGTTTLDFPSADLQSLTVYVQVNATSSSGAFNSVLTLTPYASDDDVNFFPYDNTVQATGALSATTSTALASTTIPITWLPSSIGATTTKAIKLQFVPAKYTKLVYTLVASTTPFTQQQSISLWSNVSGQIFSY